jgi:hypothetical protein
MAVAVGMNVNLGGWWCGRGVVVAGSGGGGDNVGEDVVCRVCVVGFSFFNIYIYIYMYNFYFGFLY